MKRIPLSASARPFFNRPFIKESDFFFHFPLFVHHPSFTYLFIHSQKVHKRQHPEEIDVLWRERNNLRGIIYALENIYISFLRSPRRTFIFFKFLLSRELTFV